MKNLIHAMRTCSCIVEKNVSRKYRVVHDILNNSSNHSSSSLELLELSDASASSFHRNLKIECS